MSIGAPNTQHWFLEFRSHRNGVDRGNFYSHIVVLDRAEAHMNAFPVLSVPARALLVLFCSFACLLGRKNLHFCGPFSGRTCKSKIGEL